MTNHSKEEKHFSIFSYVEFCLWNAMDDMTNFQRNYSTGEVEIHGSAIYHKTEYRERRNHYAVYSVNAPIAGFDTSRDAFLGAYGENSAPEVVVSGSCKNSVASGWAPVGSHQLDVTLAPGESRTYVFVLGYVENPAAEKWVGRPEDGIINRTPAEKLLEKFNTTEKADQALADLKAYWEKLLSHFTVSSKEEKLDRMVNIWHQYQCMVTFNMSRSASYYESGIGRGMGFRDSCQDLLGFVHLIPDRARQRILDIASTQFEDGSAYHQYQPLTKKGNSDIGSGFNDDPLWLIAGTAAYIKETRLAKAARSQVELRDPHANYNKMDMETLKKNFPTFNWDVYFTTSGLKDLKEVNIGQPAAMKEVADIINTVPLEDQKFYLQWNLIDAAASFLSDDFVAQNFDFYSRTMSGKKEMQPRWKRAVSTVDGSLGEVVGQMYVEKYFPAAAKERMVALVKNLQSSLGERIKALEWMSEPTKVKALEKLATFHVKIGYPDKWKDYSALEIKDDSYWANIERASQWDFNDMIAKAGKPVDKDEWLMTPQTVNAYYNPTTNEICFPAAILQAPFFDMNADDAMNYGAIGVVIGHEMTHGFDDQGRQYDKDGNLKDWWTEEDAKKFEERAQVMVNFFDSIEVAPGVHGNGELTLGENIADHGGLQVSFQAFKKAMEAAPLEVVDGFTPEQRFFLAYANVWAGHIRPEEILRLTKLDPHSLGKWRVDGALPHIQNWYEAFNITEHDPMFVAKDKRVSIW